jgi:hypothetical protein
MEKALNFRMDGILMIRLWSGKAIPEIPLRKEARTGSKPGGGDGA